MPIEVQTSQEKPTREKKPKTPRVKQKNDPTLVSAARELRDRWLEHVNESPLRSSGKYDVSRQIETTRGPRLPMQLPPPVQLIEQAA